MSTRDWRSNIDVGGIGEGRRGNGADDMDMPPELGEVDCSVEFNDDDRSTSLAAHHVVSDHSTSSSTLSRASSVVQLTTLIYDQGINIPPIYIYI